MRRRTTDSFRTRGGHVQESEAQHCCWCTTVGAVLCFFITRSRSSVSEGKSSMTPRPSQTKFLRLRCAATAGNCIARSCESTVLARPPCPSAGKKPQKLTSAARKESKMPRWIPIVCDDSTNQAIKVKTRRPSCLLHPRQSKEYFDLGPIPSRYTSEFPLD